jgi:hypothetical protein
VVAATIHTPIKPAKTPINNPFSEVCLEKKPSIYMLSLAPTKYDPTLLNSSRMEPVFFENAIAGRIISAAHSMVNHLAALR